MVHEYKKDNFTISTNPDLLDIEVIHSFLVNSYWIPGVPREVVVRSIKHSLCFGLYDRNKQIGFARIVTDYTHFAYLADVFVLEEYRGRGLGTWLGECIMSYLEPYHLRRMILATRDAHEFYKKFGFEEIKNPERLMTKAFDVPWLNKNS